MVLPSRDTPLVEDFESVGRSVADANVTEVRGTGATLTTGTGDKPDLLDRLRHCAILMPSVVL
jgi:hypothetical protein